TRPRQSMLAVSSKNLAVPVSIVAAVVPCVVPPIVAPAGPLVTPVVEALVISPVEAPVIPPVVAVVPLAPCGSDARGHEGGHPVAAIAPAPQPCIPIIARSRWRSRLVRIHG